MKTDEYFIGLRPDVSISFMPDHAVVSVSGQDAAYLRYDQDALQLTKALLVQLGEAKTFAQIIKNLDEWRTNDINLALTQLKELGLLYKYNKCSSPAQAASFSTITYHPDLLQERIAGTRILIFDREDEFSEALVLGLHASGVQSISRNSDCKTVLNDENAWASLIERHDLIIAFGRSADEVAALNRHCIATGKPFLYGWWQGFDIHFGPLVVPGKSACFTCLNLGMGRIPYPKGSQVSAGSKVRIMSAAFSMAALVVDYSVGMEEQVLYRHWEIDLREGSTTLHSVLRNPRCPQCSRLQKYPGETIAGY
ncbi:MAG: hypothetical protein GWP07_02460 [Xanthomonadaceae bacterium]|nr:hypothetical protein [Xanthomonadaceae bacterium]